MFCGSLVRGLQAPFLVVGTTDAFARAETVFEMGIFIAIVSDIFHLSSVRCPSLTIAPLRR